MCQVIFMGRAQTVHFHKHAFVLLFLLAWNQLQIRLAPLLAFLLILYFASTTFFTSRIATAGQFQENLIYSAPPGEYKREYLNYDKVSNHRDGRREHS